METNRASSWRFAGISLRNCRPRKPFADQRDWPRWETAGIVAHEINNPLEAIVNLFYLLKRHPSLDQEARRYAMTAEQELLPHFAHNQADTELLS